MSTDALGTLDIRQMRLLALLLAEESVSRVATLTGQSQSTVSTALARLRDLFGDPLLVRSGARLVATERGAALRPALTRILAEVDAHLDMPAGFDPSKTDRRFAVVCSNSLGPLLLPLLVARFRAAAPRAGLDLRGVPDDSGLVGGLEAGRIDLAVVNAPFAPDPLRIAPLLACDLVCLMRRDHPRAGSGRLSLTDYLALDHLTPTPPEQRDVGPIDGRLKALGAVRRVAVSVPEFGVIPFVLAETDLVFTTGRPLAEHLAARMPLGLVEAPTELGRMEFHMLWHDRQHQSPAHLWLRGVVRRAAATLKPPAVASAPAGRRAAAGR